MVGSDRHQEDAAYVADVHTKKKTRKVKGAIRRLAAYVPALLKKKKRKATASTKVALCLILKVC